jgi:D-alanyl-D-alanine endopeptidase (penicillin-binding protein 7)
MDDNIVVEEQNIDTVRPMASITKIMTALVVINSGIDLDKTVTVTGPEHSPRIMRGQTITRRELLDLTLVNSDNLAARTLAETSEVDYSTFIDRMNWTARQLGMRSTVYVDSTGIRADNVGSPEDLMLLVQMVGNFDVFKRAAMLPATVRTLHRGKQQITVSYSNTNWLAGRLDILAAKTGTTMAAGRCLTMSFIKNGHHYILVVLGARHSQERQILVQRLIDRIN